MSLSLKAESEEAKLFDVDVSDMMDGVSVTGSSVTGTLKYLSGSNAITDVWGEGYFFCFTLADNSFTGLDSVKVGVEPSQGSGLVEIINDPDKNGIVKIGDDVTQKFVILQTKGTTKKKQVYDLSGLVLAEPEAEG